MTDPTHVALGLAALAGIALLWVVFGRKKKSNKLPDVTEGKRGWYAVNSPGVELSIPPGLPSLFSFRFGEPHAIVNYGQRLTLGGAIRVRYRVTGGGFAPVQYPDKHALVGLIIQRKGDNLSGAAEYVSHRFYWIGLPQLAAGEHEISVLLVPEAWANRDGKHDPAGFAAAIANAAGAGITFGHDAGRAHGVRGEGTFEVIGWEVTP